MSEAKKIFISGASKGIGLAIAQHFYAQGFTVAICARNPASLEAAKETMPNLRVYACDVSQREAVQSLVETLTQDHGHFDVLINNAGIFLGGNLTDGDEDVYAQVMRTNVDSAYYLTRGLAPAMKTRKSGAIINICSVASIRAYTGGGAYCMSKHAMLGFGKVLRHEMMPFGIRVMNVLPGAVLTDSWASSDLPKSRFMPVEDIAQAVWDSYKLSERTVVEEVILRPFLGDI